MHVLRYSAPQAGQGAIGYLREYVLSLSRIRRLLALVNSRAPVDVIFSCNPPDLLVFLTRRLARSGVAVVFDHHDLSPELYQRKFGRRGLVRHALVVIERAAYRRADVVIQPNESYAAIARLRARVPDNRMFVVRHAADTTRFFPETPVPDLRRGRKHLVLWIGDITHPQRVLALVDAAQEIVQHRGRADIAFTLVGPGDARSSVLADVRRRGLTDVVELPGPAYDEQLRAYLATADVCVSVDLRNPMNDASTVTKVIDYMTMGRPIIQFPLPEMSRVCGDSTLYVREGNAVELADAIESLVDDPERAESLGASARQRVLDRLDWRHQVPVLLQALDRGVALAQARSGRRRNRIRR